MIPAHGHPTNIRMNEKPTSAWTRRDFLKRGGSSLAAFGAIPLAARAGAESGADGNVGREETARGTVFLDADGSGVADGQRGIPGVLVSNGTDIVETDGDGRYELPVRGDAVLHVIKPRGHRTRLDSTNLPRFHYIHRPAGSPDGDFIYKGVPPTGPLPERIDFPLYPQDEPDSFDMILTADPQCYDLRQLQWYAVETTHAFRRHGAKFGIALGDIVGDHLDLYEPYNAINARCGFPWYNVIGNHDLNFKATEDRYSGETFTRVFGPTTFAFQYARVHFIILNNVYWEGFDGLRGNGWPRNMQYHGKIRPDQLDYVRNYLRHVPADDRVVVCSHIPMVNPVDAGDKHRTPEFGELLRLLSGHRHTMSFAGHTHINVCELLGADAGYDPPGGALHTHYHLTATCGSWYRGPFDQYGVPFAPGRDGSPRGYAVVRFEGGESCRVSVKPLTGRPDGGTQMSVTLPPMVERAELAATKVGVNVFTGSTRTRVSMRVDDEGDWTELERASGQDPAYVALRKHSEEHTGAGRGTLPPPVVTDHLWEAALPVGIAPGWHTLTVRARGASGERWQERRTFVVAEFADDLERYNQGVLRPRNV